MRIRMMARHAVSDVIAGDGTSLIEGGLPARLQRLARGHIPDRLTRIV